MIFVRRVQTNHRTFHSPFADFRFPSVFIYTILFRCIVRAPLRLSIIIIIMQSIKERLELHTAKRDEEYLEQTPTKLSKKEKKKQKEAKKLAKQKKIDADKVSTTHTHKYATKLQKYTNLKM